MNRCVRLFPLFAVTALVSACGGGGGSGGTGTLGVSLTDAPACGYDAVWITVAKVRAHRSDDAADGDGGWSEIVVDPPQRLDLLALQNGELEDLGQTTLPAGTYNQMRLVLDDTAGANELVRSDTKATVALKTPSAQQSGLKLKHTFEVGANETTRLVLDFDACRSIVKAGTSGQYLLKPVISVIDADTSGSIVGAEGQVEPEAARADATVSLQQYDPATGEVTVVRSTPVRDDGSWLLSPVPEASADVRYQLVLSSPGYANVVYTDIPLQTGVATAVPPVTLAVSTMGEIDGEVTPADPSAALRALQKVVDEPGDADDVVIEAAYANSDASTGLYRLEVPVAAARVAAYASSSPSFADGANAGVYEVAATVEGATQTGDADVSTTNQTLDFAF